MNKFAKQSKFSSDKECKMYLVFQIHLLKKQLFQTKRRISTTNYIYSTFKTGFIAEDSSLGDVIAYIATTDEDNSVNSMTNINIFDEGLLYSIL